MRYQQNVLLLISTIWIVGITACSNEERSSASGTADDTFTVSLPDAGPSNAPDITIEDTVLPGDTLSGNDTSATDDVPSAEDSSGTEDAGPATEEDAGSTITVPAPTTAIPIR